MNHFPYDDPPPQGDAPLSLHAEIAGCPWEPTHRLLRIGLSAKTAPEQAGGGAFRVVAKDVKLQVTFNPTLVAAYRQIGYERRVLREEEFADDRKDAGEIHAGHAVTVFYEMIPVGGSTDGYERVVPLSFEAASGRLDPTKSDEVLTLSVRFKERGESASRLLSLPVTDPGSKLADASVEFKFAASVAMFGMLLRRDEHLGPASWDDVEQLAAQGQGPDLKGRRAEFVGLVTKARSLAGK